MCKKKYEEPKFDLIEFDIQDILTTSTEAFDGEWVPIGGGTHDEVCTECGYVEVDNETHTFDSTTGKCEFCEVNMAEAKLTSGETDTYYQTLMEALTASKSGDTVTLCKSVDTGTTEHTIPEGVIFNGGEYTVTGNGAGWFYNNGTIVGGKFAFFVDNTGTIKGGSFYSVNNGGTVEGGSFEDIDCMDDSSLSGSVMIIDDINIFWKECTIDLSNADFEGSVRLYNGTEQDLLISVLNPPEGYAVEWNGAVVSVLPAWEYGYFVEHSHTYEPAFDDTHHWTECACGKATEKAEHSYTYTENGENHTVGCSGCEYSKSETHTLTYTANGNIITATCSANCGYSETATITAENTTYNGTEQMTATVTYSEGWTGGELTVSYANNTNAGTATASITLGEATASVEFTIVPATIAVEMITVNSTVYNGEVQKPNGSHVTVIVNGRTLVYNTDYSIGCYPEDEFINAGTYTITIYGQFNYEGSVTVTFEITCDHTFSEHTEGTPNSNGTHNYHCTICDEELSEDCKGGNATCTEQAVCSICKEPYGELDANHHTSNTYTNGFRNCCGEYQTATDSNSDGVYEISNAGQLYWFAAEVNSGKTSMNGKLTANIVVNENVLTENGEPNGDGSGFRVWTPIGGDYENRYVGTFDGGGHTVSGLYLNDSRATFVGLFGAVGTNGKVQNVGVEDSYFHGDVTVGGVAGTIYGGTVTNCYNTGTVNGSSFYAGGVVGFNDEGGTVTNCYYLDSIDGGDGSLYSLPLESFADAYIATMLNYEQADEPWEYIEGDPAPTLKSFNETQN